MGTFFQDDLLDEFGSVPLAFTAMGGVDVGVIRAVARAVGSGDAAAFWAEWVAAGDRIAAEAEAAEAKGRRAEARASWLAAASCYTTAGRPLFGRPVDPRLREGFGKSVDALHRGLALGAHPVGQRRIPYEATSLPGYFLPAAGRETETRPLVILTNGYDATAVDLYFGAAAAMSRGGYHVLFFDGPGQGEMLIEQGITLRPDWENVIRPVVDFALTLPGVDPARIVLSGWSLGGLLALRGASGEPRLAACVADPGISEGLPPDMVRGIAGEAAAATQASHLLQAAFQKLIAVKPRMRWTVLQRGFWVLGVDDLSGFIAASRKLTATAGLGDIRCPVLLTTAESDPLSYGAAAIRDTIGARATLLHFTDAEGAGDHCSWNNRSLLNRRVLAWLDETLASPPA